MSRRVTILPLEIRSSYGAHLLDHLAADGAGLPGGQVAVVAVGQIDADLGSCLHLELVHCLAGLRNIDLIVALHIRFSPFAFFGKGRFPKKPSFLSVALFFPGENKKSDRISGRIGEVNHQKREKRKKAQNRGKMLDKWPTFRYNTQVACAMQIWPGGAVG